MRMGQYMTFTNYAFWRTALYGNKFKGQYT